MMLASRGCRVIVNDICDASTSENPAADVVEEIRALGGIAVADNHSVLGEADAIIETASRHFERLDILINNAGILDGTTLEDTPAELWQKVADIHYRGTADCCRAAWPLLVKSGSGRIINTSSSGMLGNAGLTSYGSAKAAIFGLTKSLAVEALPFGITVNCILPSAWTRITNMIEDETIASTLQSRFQPEHVAAFVCWLAHQDTIITNEAFRVSSGGAARVMMMTAAATRPDESSPEAWVENQTALMSSSGKLIPVASTIDLFGLELAEAEPGIKLDLALESGGLDIDSNKT
jgi:NAD(P)-dependent dehydrogenase (short-subunit alcohol dehydrogenase family)